MSDTMAQALLQGQMAATRGNIDLARQWLEQAVALEPTGAIALLVLAGAKLMLKSDEAAELYAGVAKEHDLREAWIGLAAACHIQAEVAQAADALGHAFGHHAVAVPDLTSLADGVVYAAYGTGWCALDSGGNLVIRLASERTSKLRPDVTIDGRRLALHAKRTAVVSLRAYLKGGNAVVASRSNWATSNCLVAHWISMLYRAWKASRTPRTAICTAGPGAQMIPNANPSYLSCRWMEKPASLQLQTVTWSMSNTASHLPDHEASVSRRCCCESSMEQCAYWGTTGAT